MSMLGHLHNFPKPIFDTMGAGSHKQAMEGLVNSSISSYEKKALDGIIDDTMGGRGSSGAPKHDLLKVEASATKKPIGARHIAGSRFT